MKEQLQQDLIEIVNLHPGIHGPTIPTHFAMRNSKTNEELFEYGMEHMIEELENLANSKLLVEVEYVLPSEHDEIKRIKSLYFPANTEILDD